MKAVLALDQGTTSSRAIVFDRSAKVLSVAQREFQQVFPHPGWVEHDPREIWQSQLEVMRQALEQAGLEPQDLAAIGIANQRETTVVWDRRTGEPIANALVWQDRRTAEYCKQLCEAGYADRIQQKTGLVVDAYFSGSKIGWLLDHIPRARQRAERGELAFGTVDSWLIWNLSGGRLHVTDVSNASRTMLMNLATGDWDDELLQWLQIPREILPTIHSSSECYGSTVSEILGRPVIVAGVAGDQQAALFGQQCVKHGSVKNTYGTGCFMLMHLGQEPKPSKHRLLTTAAWRLAPGGPSEFALEGSTFVAGAAVQWLRDGLGIIRDARYVEPLAASVTDADGVMMVPAFTGLGAPHWDPHARGTLLGMTRGTSAAHIARAALDGIAQQVADVLDAMREYCGFPIAEVRVDGGGAANNLLMQMQADLLGAPVARPRILETTALGAAYLAGLAVGFWSGLDELACLWQVDRVFEPQISTDERHAQRARWQRALARAANWASDQ
ncbi:MAG: Glycerol kinase [Planctomycetota bacterium]